MRITYADGTTGKFVSSRATWEEMPPDGDWNVVTYQGPDDRRPTSRPFVRFENEGQTTVLKFFEWTTSEEAGGITHRLNASYEKGVPTGECRFYRLTVHTHDKNN